MKRTPWPLKFASAGVLLGVLTACGGGGAAPASSSASSAAAPPASSAAASSAAAKPSGAASAGASGAVKSSQDTLTIAEQPVLGTADPHFVATNQEMLITRNVYSALLKYKPNTTELTGDLATDWSVSPDGLTYTFHLRKDVDWQKGFGHFTANDVKASFDRLRDPATKSPFRGAISMLKDVQVVDAYTVKLILNQPYAAFPQLLTDYRTGPIVNVKAVQKYGKDFNWNPVGTGPYEFDSRIPAQQVVLVANDKYFGGAPPIKKIIIKTVPDLNAEVVGVENGQYDMMLSSSSNIDPAVTKRVKSEGLGVSDFSRDNPEVLLMNQTVKPWDNLKVRQAVAYGIDRQQIIDLTAPDLAHPWYSPIPEGFPYVDKNLPHYDHDVNKAKALLAEAGYPNGLDTTMNVYDTVKSASDVIVEQLRQVGIRLTEDQLDQTTFISRVVTDKGINFTVHCCVRQPDPDIILSDMFSAKYRGAIYVSHWDLEPELAKARMELDPKKREQDYFDIQKKIIDNVGMIPIAMVNDRSFHKANLKGLPTLEPLWGLDLARLYFQ